MRERRKQPSKITYYLIYNREGYNRRSYTHHSPAESEASSSSNDDDTGEFNEARKAKLEEEARLALREVTRKAEAEAAREEEEERQALEDVENGEKLLRLAANISSDLE